MMHILCILRFHLYHFQVIGYLKITMLLKKLSTVVNVCTKFLVIQVFQCMIFTGRYWILLKLFFCHLTTVEPCYEEPLIQNFAIFYFSNTFSYSHISTSWLKQINDNELQLEMGCNKINICSLKIFIVILIILNW